MRTAPLSLPLATAVLASSLGACSIEDDFVTQPRAGDELVEICHVPPGYPDGASTILVPPSDVEDHLDDHADTLGPCPTACELECDELSATVLATCEDMTVGWPVPENFCDQAAAEVNAACDSNCPTPTPEECNAFCGAIADETLDACFELIGDPLVCHTGADITFQECVATFECPLPPPTCEDECFFAFEAAIQQCELTGGDPVCFDEAMMMMETCVDGCCVTTCNASCVSQCDGDAVCVATCQSQCPQACEPPPPGCFDECYFAFDQAIQQCDMLGGDPQCFFMAEQQLMACQAGCCVEDCGAQCPIQCADDPECISACDDQCAMACPLPPPLCDPNMQQLCPDGSCVPLGEPCPEPLCDPMMEQLCPDGSCVPLGVPCPEPLCDPIVDQLCPDVSCVPLGVPCPEPLCDPMMDQLCPDGSCVPLDEPCPEEPCDPMTEKLCPDGLCAPLGEPCPVPPPTCEDQCGPDPQCFTDCCIQGCMADDPLCLEDCCFLGCEIASPEDPLSCIEQQCIGA